MFCPKCGTNIPDGALFCPKCGTRILQDAPNVSYQNQGGSSSLPQQSSVQSAAAYIPAALPETKAKKKPGWIPAVIILAGLAAGLWFFGKPFLEKYIDLPWGKKQDSPVEVIIPEDLGQSSSSQVSNTDETGSSDDTHISPDPGSSESTVTEPVPEPSNTETEPESSGVQSSVSESVSQPSAEQTHTGELSFDSFITAESFLETGIPSTAEWRQPYTFEGAWGYEMIFDELGYSEIGDCSVVFGQNGVTLDLYPTYAKDGYEMYPTSREEIGYNTFSGSMRDEDFILEDPGHASTISVGTFIFLDGEEYAYGSIATSNGLIGTLIFKRY
ncbi:MAG: zinc-ribbon domain-containing protein [Oscillospiraceae bacterium]|nr:zinc-ribbon domain-containing protein [Oscillospiraceae bacterium]